MKKGSWRQLLQDESKILESLQRTEKFEKTKRSNKGRTVDDWFVDLAEGSHEKVLNLLSQGYRVGRVVEAHKRYVFVAEENEEKNPDTNLLWLCTIAKRHFQRSHVERNFVVVGDKVLFVPDGDVTFSQDGEVLNSDLPHGTIQHAFGRQKIIARKDPLRPQWQHVMLANIDYVVIVASVFHPEVRWGLIDRILVQAESHDVDPIIVLNKVDLLSQPKLATPAFMERYRKRIEIYRSIGYKIFEISALTPKSTLTEIKELRQLFKNKLIGFAGHSGVGKSSLLNLMKPEIEQIVDDNPEIFYKGRHTTTYNSLLRLDIGGYAIDTPGIRSFDIEEKNPILLSSYFREFRGIKCKFRECAHDKETSCAIKEAIAEGKISKERYHSYLGILRGVSLREGEGDGTDAQALAEVNARLQFRDEQLRLESENSEVSHNVDSSFDLDVIDGLSYDLRMKILESKKTIGSNLEQPACNSDVQPKKNELGTLARRKKLSTKKMS